MKLAFVDFEGSGGTVNRVWEMPAGRTRPYCVRGGRLWHTPDIPHHSPGYFMEQRFDRERKGCAYLKAELRLV